MQLSFTISDLRQRPAFFDTVADRIWRAWWEPGGYPLAHVAARLRESMSDTPIPFALVAHDRERFLGTTSVIESDVEERPQLTPWVAAVWVDEDARRSGVASSLVNRATQDCFALGIKRAWLCSRPQRQGFYGGLGWTIAERDVGPHRLNVYFRDAEFDRARISSPPCR
jgi:N-acetylglutamate synthase-like GNAT family acetyltransferase